MIYTSKVTTNGLILEVGLIEQLLMKVRRVVEKEVPNLGARIKEARETDSRSLAEICRQIPMTPMNWYKIEAEETKALPIETLRRIEEVLGVDFEVEL
jgi:ribosome-binding protein aMBF1 (putative translation factor)